MEVALPRTTAGRPGVIESPATRRAILAVLVLEIVACLGTVAVIVLTRGTGDGLGDRLSSLQDDSVPGTDESDNREQLLTLSREFATRFNTYDESMLDDAGHLTDYAAVEDLMTPKFGSVFTDNVGYAEETVKQLGVASEGTVYAVGVASQDADSAEVLVAGTIELTYPVPEGDQGSDDTGADETGDDETGDDPEGDPERLSTGPQRFRYQLAMVKIDGAWFVDDVDDIDDGLPPFSQPGIPETDTGQAPTTPPTTTPPTGQTEEGEQ
jgi:Mce-associated membrane protein